MSRGNRDAFWQIGVVVGPFIAVLPTASLLVSCFHSEPALQTPRGHQLVPPSQDKLLEALSGIRSEVDAELGWDDIERSWSWASRRGAQAVESCSSNVKPGESIECGPLTTLSIVEGAPLLGLPPGIEVSTRHPDLPGDEAILTLTETGELLYVSQKASDGTWLDIFATRNGGWMATRKSEGVAVLGIRAGPGALTMAGSIGRFSADRASLLTADSFWENSEGSGGVASWIGWQDALPTTGEQTVWEKGVVHHYASVQSNEWTAFWLEKTCSGRICRYMLTTVQPGLAIEPHRVRSSLELSGPNDCQIALWHGSDWEVACPLDGYLVSPERIPSSQ